MQIHNMQIFKGRNIYCHRPVIRMTVDLEGIHALTTRDIDGFNENLLKLFPGLNKHHCSPGYEGGFTARLKEGTYTGHVMEHLILELQNMMGYEVFYGKTRIHKEPSIYYIIYEYMNERCGVECGKAGIDIISGMIDNENADMETILNNLKKVATETDLGPSAAAILSEAEKRGIPCTRMGNESLIQLGQGKYSRLVEASLIDATSCINVDIAGNKYLTKQILMDNKIPVPYGDIAYTMESAAALAKEIGYPVVVKPYDSNQGKGVTLDIHDETQVGTAYNEAIKYSSAVIVEKFIKGKDYRILVVGDRVSAVSERRPPSVAGDGVHSIRELVEIENRNPLRGDNHEKPLTKIKLDNIAKGTLSGKRLDEQYIPALNEAVILRNNGNLSTGGTARDCTDEIHPYNGFIAVKAAKAIGLDIAGVDMTIEDISNPISLTNGAVIEINAAPGLRMHLYPTEGTARNVASDIADMLFPLGQPYSVPIVSITGTNGKTTTTRLIRHIISLTGKTVGMTSTSGVYIGDKCILKGDNTGPVSARMVLSNREVEAAVLETARGGIVRKGLGYDMADVGVVVNISDDHLGLDDLDTIDDLAFVKSLVIEAVKPEGYAVLNADDCMIGYLLGRAAGNVILFSRETGNPILKKHMQTGGKSVYVFDTAIYLYDGKKSLPLIELDEIPITFGGIVECNIENSLAAVSALFGLNVHAEIIKTGLRSFRPDIVSNPGRFNIFDMGDFKVMLDYSHNTAGYNAVSKFVQKLNTSRLVGIIGVPGDRLDRNIMDVGAICGKAFSRIYIKEDSNLRGREQGEVAQILFDSVLKSGCKKENTGIIHSELKALEAAILDAQPGDLIIMFYEEFEPAVELINRFKQELEQSVIRPAAAVEESV